MSMRHPMKPRSRRDMLKGSLALAALGVFDLPAWALPAFAQSEALVPFTDIPENIKWETPPDRRLLTLTTIPAEAYPRHDLVIAELRALREAGVLGLVVELSCHGLGRDIAGIKRVCDGSGVPVIAATGYACSSGVT